MKVLAVNGKRTEEIYDSFGKQKLYPDGTERIVRRFNFFKGWVVSLEKTEIKWVCGSDGTLYYNDWKKVMDVPNDEHYHMMVKWNSPEKV